MIIYVETCEDCPFQSRTGMVRCLITGTPDSTTQKQPRNPNCPLTEELQMHHISVAIHKVT